MDEQTEETTVEATDELLIGYGQIFAQLLQSERFKLFFDTNFTLQKFVDEGTKTIDFQVIENPPEIVARRLAEAMAKNKDQVELISGKVAQSVMKNLKK